MEDGLENKTMKTAALSAGCRWIAHRPVVSVCLYIVAVSAFFLLFPQVDLWASGLFYSDVGGFFAKSEPLLRRFRHLGPHLVKLIAIACLLTLLLKLVLPGRRPLMPLRMPVFLLTSLILGPGVLVNLILKNNWGRPRPVMVEIFGGDMPYQPVWKITQWCDTNCSFVSGEASAGMWLVAAVVFVAPLAWRPLFLAFFLPLSLLLSLNRIAFGGHFLSDTLLSWGLTLLVILLVHRLIYRPGAGGLRDSWLDEKFTRFGRRLHVEAKRTGARLSGAAHRFLGKFKSG